MLMVVVPDSDGFLLFFGDDRGRRWALTQSSEGSLEGATRILTLLSQSIRRFWSPVVRGCGCRHYSQVQ